MIAKMKPEQAPILQKIFWETVQNLPLMRKSSHLFCGDTFVASHAGEELGFACVNESGEIVDFYVRPLWQGKTVGSQIVQALQSEKTALYVERKELSERAARFFIKNGFRAQEGRLIWIK